MGSGNYNIVEHDVELATSHQWTSSLHDPKLRKIEDSQVHKTASAQQRNLVL